MTFFKGKICKLIAINSVVFSCFVFDGNTQELPENPSVTHGNASFEKVGNNLTINQSTQKLITNWSSFNIGKANQVEFKQPSSVSTALNRVQSNDPTQIDGSLKSIHESGSVVEKYEFNGVSLRKINREHDISYK